MDYGEARKRALKLFIGFLTLTGLIAIGCVVIGDLGELELKILATSFTIAAASVASMGCTAFIERQHRPALGLTGIALAISAAVLVILGLWLDLDNELFTDLKLTLIVSAVAVSYALLLLSPTLDERHAWIQRVSTAAITVLALLIVVDIWGDIEDSAYYQLLAAVAIVVGILTVVVPITLKLRSGDSGPSRRLLLEHITGDQYRDAAGNTYRVTPSSGPSEEQPVAR